MFALNKSNYLTSYFVRLLRVACLELMGVL